ncbi:MAG: PLP-dependent cysteine synthase family protein [Burkholderiales bacterium]
MRQWTNTAIKIIEADFHRTADTHLIRLDLPCLECVQFYLKDESTHPTGSLKHRLARSLFLFGLCNGLIHEDTPIIEASSGSTAVSEAYFARLLGLPFIAVMPKGTSQEKIDQVTFYGGTCHFVDSQDIYAEAHRLARERRGHYMDQFTNAERVTDWRGNNNIADSIFTQMQREEYPVPAWVVMSAGTGGTSATIGRYIRYRCHATKLCVADPEHSVFREYYEFGDPGITLARSSNVEGIGRPRVEPSFVPGVIDRMMTVPDAASFATMRVLEGILNRKCGGSTGTNMYAAFQIAAELNAQGHRCSMVSMICDSGERYLDTYYNDRWLKERGFVLEPYQRQLAAFLDTGRWHPTADRASKQNVPAHAPSG